jgi:small-conductance mechanosensitive channel
MVRLATFFKIIGLILFIGIRFFTPGWIPSLQPPVPAVEVLLNFLIFVLALNLFIQLLIYFYRKGKKLTPSQIDNVIVGMQNVYYIIFALAFILSIAAALGFPPGELFTSLSIVAAAIAIISKDFLSEIISGMIITFSREVEIDDYVKIGDQKGKIIDITLTKIALLNEDDDIIFIPNHMVYNSEIFNYTRKQIKKVSIEFELNIQALKTVEEFESDLIDVLSDYREHIVPESYNLKIVDIHKDCLNLKFQFVLHRINRELEREVRKKTVRRVVNYVKQHRPASPAGAG